jgi:hypothetical protein
MDYMNMQLTDVIPKNEPLGLKMSKRICLGKVGKKKTEIILQSSSYIELFISMYSTGK